MTSSRRSPQREQGVTVVLFAVSITALLALASLVLGGSTGYTAERNAQNASDAASLAATSTLREVWLGQRASSEVLGVAVSVAEDNGAVAGTVQCDVVTAQYAVANSAAEVIGPCDGTSLDPSDGTSKPNPEHADAAGVRVESEDTRDVPFGVFVDQETITAETVAAATIQPLRGGVRAPFMLCADATDHGVPLLLEDGTKDPPWAINEKAFGINFLLWSNGNGFGDRNCRVSPWHGLVNTDRLYQIPSTPDDDSTWWDIDTGSRVGHIPRLLTGSDSCLIYDEDDDDIDAAEGCRMALPLCIDTNGNGTNARLYCVRMATFKITYVGDGDAEGSCVTTNKKVVCGELLPGGVASGGQGSLEPADPSEVVVIKLVE